MAGEKQTSTKPLGGSKAFVIPQASYQVNVSKNIPVVVAQSKKPVVATSVKQIVSGNKKVHSSNGTSIKKHDNNSSNDKKPVQNKSSKNGSVSKPKIIAKKEWWEEEVDAPVIVFDSEQPWYNHYSPFVSELISTDAVETYKVDEKKYTSLLQKVELTYGNEVTIYAKAQAAAGKGNSDQKWINDVIKSGTLSDKVAALSLKTQESPFHQLEALDGIVGMACKKEQRASQSALEAVKDLLATNLLPDRKLITFKTGLLFHPDMTLKDALLLYYEGQLKIRVERIMEALETGLKSNVDYFKKICLETASSLLMSKPEQEARLLTMITNKLGDPTSKTCSKCIETLKQIIHIHPAMKGVVVREVRQFIYKPHNKLKSIFNGVLFLSQVQLQHGDHDVAAQLVECYVSLFEKAVKEDELGSRLLSALLTGINKSFPFLDNIEPIVKYADSLFRLVHTASFTSSTQALMLLSHLAISSSTSTEKKNSNDSKQAKSNNKSKHTKAGSDEHDEDQEESSDAPAAEEDGAEGDVGNDITKRYYRALYAKLLSDQVTSRAKNTLLLNLLYRSIKKDPSDHRAMAFIKRLSICATHSSPSISAGLLFLISEVLDARPNLKKMLTTEEEVSFHTTQEEILADVDEEEASNMLGNFDASKREPEYAASARPSMWEASLLRRHFHPSVQAFAHSLLDTSSNHHINFAGDPTTDFSLMAFLNRFAYKNPKKSVADNIQKRKTLSEEPINVSSFIHADEGDVAPDKQFFHKFFGEREKLRDEGRSRDRSKKGHTKKGGDDSDSDDDGEAAGSDADEAEIDEFANKLAEDMMRDAANNYDDPDMDDFSEDESDSDDSQVYDNPNAEGEDDEEEDGDWSDVDDEGDASDSDMGLDGMDGSDDDDLSEEEEEEPEPVKKSNKNKKITNNSAALDFADFVKENNKTTTNKKESKKKSKKNDSDSEDGDAAGYSGLMAYNEDEDEDLKTDKKKNVKVAAAVKAVKSVAEPKKKSSKSKQVEPEDDDDMDVMEFDDEGNCDDDSNDDDGDDFDDYDEDEEFDLIVGNESSKKNNSSKSKKVVADKSAGKRKRGKGGESSDFASADDYEAEMEAILKQIQQHSGGADVEVSKNDKKKASTNSKSVPVVSKTGGGKSAVTATKSNKKSRK